MTSINTNTNTNTSNGRITTEKEYALYVKSYLNDLLSIAASSSLESKKLNLSKAEVVEWLYNNGNLRTEHETNIKLTSIKEEMIVFEFAGNLGSDYKIAESKYRELKKVASERPSMPTSM